MLAVPVCVYVLSLSTCRHLHTFMYTPSLSPHPSCNTPKSYAYNVNNYIILMLIMIIMMYVCTHPHTHACVHSHTCTHTIPMTSTVLVTTTVPVPKMSSCGGG